MRPDCSKAVSSMRLSSPNPRDAGKRLDQLLHERLPAFSRSRIQEWISAGRVLVNGGRPAPPPTWCAPARPSMSNRPSRRRCAPRPKPSRSTILYEDDDLVAIDKPAGMVVHAGAGVHSGTLVNALLHRFGALSGVGGALRPGIVHRLDRFTSGVLLVAKNDAAHRAWPRSSPAARWKRSTWRWCTAR